MSIAQIIALTVCTALMAWGAIYAWHFSAPAEAHRRLRRMQRERQLIEALLADLDGIVETVMRAKGIEFFPLGAHATIVQAIRAGVWHSEDQLMMAIADQIDWQMLSTPRPLGPAPPAFRVVPWCEPG